MKHSNQRSSKLSATSDSRFDHQLHAHWRSVTTDPASHPPRTRDGYAFARVGRKIFVIGGLGCGALSQHSQDNDENGGTLGGTYGSSGASNGSQKEHSYASYRISEVAVYDVDTGQWKLVECSGTLPPPCSQLACVVVGQRIYIHGGEGSMMTQLRTTSENTLSSLKNGTPDTNIQEKEQAALRHVPELYRDMFVLDTLTMQWSRVDCGEGSGPDFDTDDTIGSIQQLSPTSTLASTDMGRRNSFLDASNTKLSPSNRPKSSFNQTHKQLNQRTNTRLSKSTNPKEIMTPTIKYSPVVVPEMRRGHSLSLWMNDDRPCLVLFGGFTRFEFGKHEDTPLNDVYIFDILSSRWRKMTILSDMLPSPRGAHAAIILQDNTLWVYGGLGKHGELGDLWALDLKTKRWKLWFNSPGPAALSSQGRRAALGAERGDDFTSIASSERPNSARGSIAGQSVCELNEKRMNDKRSYARSIGQQSATRQSKIGSGSSSDAFFCPLPVHGHRLTHDPNNPNRFFLFGGRGSIRSESSEGLACAVWVYNTETHTWNWLPAVPENMSPMTVQPKDSTGRKARTVLLKQMLQYPKAYFDSLVEASGSVPAPRFNFIMTTLSLSPQELKLKDLMTQVAHPSQVSLHSNHIYYNDVDVTISDIADYFRHVYPNERVFFPEGVPLSQLKSNAKKVEASLKSKRRYSLTSASGASVTEMNQVSENGSVSHDTSGQSIVTSVCDPDELITAPAPAWGGRFGRKGTEFKRVDLRQTMPEPYEKTERTGSADNMTTISGAPWKRPGVLVQASLRDKQTVRSEYEYKRVIVLGGAFAEPPLAHIRRALAGSIETENNVESVWGSVPGSDTRSMKSLQYITIDKTSRVYPSPSKQGTQKFRTENAPVKNFKTDSKNPLSAMATSLYARYQREYDYWSQNYATTSGNNLATQFQSPEIPPKLSFESFVELLLGRHSLSLLSNQSDVTSDGQTDQIDGKNDVCADPVTNSAKTSTNTPVDSHTSIENDTAQTDQLVNPKQDVTPHTLDKNQEPDVSLSNKDGITSIHNEDANFQEKWRQRQMEGSARRLVFELLPSMGLCELTNVFHLCIPPLNTNDTSITQHGGIREEFLTKESTGQEPNIIESSEVSHNSLIRANSSRSLRSIQSSVSCQRDRAQPKAVRTAPSQFSVVSITSRKKRDITTKGMDAIHKTGDAKAENTLNGSTLYVQTDSYRELINGPEFSGKVGDALESINEEDFESIGAPTTIAELFSRRQTVSMKKPVSTDADMAHMVRAKCNIEARPSSAAMLRRGTALAKKMQISSNKQRSTQSQTFSHVQSSSQSSKTATNRQYTSKSTQPQEISKSATYHDYASRYTALSAHQPSKQEQEERMRLGEPIIFPQCTLRMPAARLLAQTEQSMSSVSSTVHSQQIPTNQTHSRVWSSSPMNSQNTLRTNGSKPILNDTHNVEMEKEMTIPTTVHNQRPIDIVRSNTQQLTQSGEYRGRRMSATLRHAATTMHSTSNENLTTSSQVSGAQFSLRRSAASILERQRQVSQTDLSQTLSTPRFLRAEQRNEESTASIGLNNTGNCGVPSLNHTQVESSNPALNCTMYSYNPSESHDKRIDQDEFDTIQPDGFRAAIAAGLVEPHEHMAFLQGKSTSTWESYTGTGNVQLTESERKQKELMERMKLQDMTSAELKALAAKTFGPLPNASKIQSRTKTTTKFAKNASVPKSPMQRSMYAQQERQNSTSAKNANQSSGSTVVSATTPFRGTVGRKLVVNSSYGKRMENIPSNGDNQPYGGNQGSISSPRSARSIHSYLTEGTAGELMRHDMMSPDESYRGVGMRSYQGIALTRTKQGALMGSNNTKKQSMSPIARAQAGTIASKLLEQGISAARYSSNENKNSLDDNEDAKSSDMKTLTAYNEPIPQPNLTALRNDMKIRNKQLKMVAKQVKSSL